jgi:O-antigen/teichoic acid export membrane protein
VGQLVLLLGLWLAGWFSVGGVLAVNLVAVAGAWGVTVWPLERRRPAWIQWDVPLLRETLGQSLVLHLGMVIYFLHFRLDMFMVSGMVGTAALGHYSLAVALAETVLLATDSLALAVLPRQIGGSLEAAASLALKGARANALVASGLGLLWAATGAMVIRGFFGSAFAPAYGPLVALLPGIVFLSLERLCGGPTLRTGRRTRITLIYAGAFLCNVALNLWWIPVWGILGAALASSVSYGVEALVILGWTARLAGVPLSQGIVPRRSDWADLWRAGVQATHLLQDAYLARKQVP